MTVVGRVDDDCEDMGPGPDLWGQLPRRSRILGCALRRAVLTVYYITRLTHTHACSIVRYWNEPEGNGQWVRRPSQNNVGEGN